MKDLSKKTCGHGVSVKKKSEDCSFHFVCGFYGYSCAKRKKHDVTMPETLWN